MALIPRPKWILFIIYLAVVHLLAALYIRHLISDRRPAPVGSAMAASNAVSSSDTAVRTGDTAAQPARYAGVSGPADKLLIPVAGIKKSDLQDTYTQSRAGGRGA